MRKRCRCMKKSIIATGIILILISCLLPAAVSAQVNETASVEIGDFFFEPDSIEVLPGTTVVWTNLGEVAHTVTSDDQLFDSGNLNPNETFEFTFTDPGMYGYFCSIHPQMTAEVVVTAENVTGGPSVVVEDQEIAGESIIVADVVSEGAGWIVIHAEENATFGPIVGFSPVSDGANPDVSVSLDLANVTDTLYAMLHTDAGTVGEFEFPGPDEPVIVDGEVLAPPFSVAAPSVTSEVALELVADGFTAPVGAIAAPDGSGRLFIVDQTGVVRIMEANGTMIARPFVDVTNEMVDLSPAYDERGLLGFAFHPDYTENGKVYAYYSAPLRDEAPDDWDHTSRIAEFMVSPTDPLAVMVGSERVLLEVDQPQANNNGGQITFGPDGYLTIALGDGGGAADVGTGHPPDGNGQNTTTLLGSILRIDVDGEQPYAIPDDNPFLNETDGLPEIYAYGFKNPYRFSFDTLNGGDLYAGDAGENRWEEVDIVDLGSNYGWNLKEGTHCFDPEDPNATPSECPDTGSRGEPLIDPIIEYRNAAAEDDIGKAVVGGYVYRGSAIAGLAGKYVFGDWSGANEQGNGVLFAAAPPADANATLWQIEDLEVTTTPRGDVGGYLLGFGRDADGELFVMTSEAAGPNGTTGKVSRIVPAGNETPSVVPSVTVSDQPVRNDSVVVDEVVSDGPGWIVIHAEENETFGSVLGFTGVTDGTSTDVVVAIEEPGTITETLYAMLHTDAGTEGEWEFPGPDEPVSVDGVVVAPAFTVTNSSETA
jgi:glucose/arabinose dehydrogenase/plastocyanin